MDGKYQVEKEEYRTIARTWSVNIRVTLSSELCKMTCEEEWDCWHQLDHCEKYPTLHVLLSLLESQNGHYTALLRDLPAGCVYEPGCVKLLRIPAKPRTTKPVPLSDSFAKTTPLAIQDANNDNEGYIENSLSIFDIMMELGVEQTQPKHVDDTVENSSMSAQVSVEQTPRRHVQCLAADALDSDSSELLFEALSASSVSDEMKRAGISITPSPSSNSGSAIPRCKQTPTSNAGSPPPQCMRSPSTTPEWGRSNAAEDIYS